MEGNHGNKFNKDKQSNDNNVIEDVDCKPTARKNKKNEGKSDKDEKEGNSICRNVILYVYLF